MASNALTCCAASGSAAVVSNRGSNSRGPSSVGFGPRSVMFRPSSKRLSMVVRAQDPTQQGDSATGAGSETQKPKEQQRNTTPLPKSQQPTLLSSFRYVRDPWRTSDEGDHVMVKVDMPELSREDIKVTIEGKRLMITDKTKKTVGDEMTFLLPDECVGTKVHKAALDAKGILTVTVDKVSIPGDITPIDVPVEIAKES